MSVGLGIGHVIEPLSALRQRADEAERDAKGDDSPTPRNALAVRLGIRSGAEIRWRARWCDAAAFEALGRFTSAYRIGELSTRVAYDLRDIDRRLAWLRGDSGDTARGMRQAEVERLLDRARRDGGRRRVPGDLRRLIRVRAGTDTEETVPVAAGPSTDPPGHREKRNKAAESGSIATLADTLILARWFAARTANDVGDQP